MMSKQQNVPMPVSTTIRNLTAATDYVVELQATNYIGLAPKARVRFRALQLVLAWVSRSA